MTCWVRQKSTLKSSLADSTNATESIPLELCNSPTSFHFRDFSETRKDKRNTKRRMSFWYVRGFSKESNSLFALGSPLNPMCFQVDGTAYAVCDNSWSISRFGDDLTPFSADNKQVGDPVRNSKEVRTPIGFLTLMIPHVLCQANSCDFSVLSCLLLGLWL